MQRRTFLVYLFSCFHPKIFALAFCWFALYVPVLIYFCSNKHIQDVLVVSYLANTIRTQMELSNRLATAQLTLGGGDGSGTATGGGAGGESGGQRGGQRGGRGRGGQQRNHDRGSDELRA